MLKMKRFHSNLETEITTNTYHEYLPLQADSKLLNRPWNEIVGENLIVSKVIQTTQLLSFNVNSPKTQVVSVGQFYFPGQILYVDNQISRFGTDKEGRINFTLRQGDHSILV